MSSSSSSTNRAVAEEEVAGFRFKPTDEELVTKFLKKKMQGKASLFPEVTCCNHEPKDLHALLVPTKDMEWFFFSQRDFKYTKSKRSNRATEQGFWKITGTPLKIKDEHSQAVMGYKRFLTFYEGRVPNASKTNYIMHEYDLAETELGSMSRPNGDFVLCRVRIKLDKSYKKKGSSICDDEADPDSYIASNFENLPASDDMIAEQDRELEDPLPPNDNVGECKEPQKDTCLIDENDISNWDYDFENQAAADDVIAKQDKELEDPLLPNDNVGECKEPQNNSWVIDDISTADECAFSEFEVQHKISQLESLLNLTQPQEQQDYCSSTLHSPKEAQLGNAPLADVNNGECSWGKSPLGDNNSCLTNKNNISTKDNHGQVSNTVSNFGSATDGTIRKGFTQPGENLEPLRYPLLQDHPLLSPKHTEPRDVLHGNNCIASIESLGTQSLFNYSFQGNSALATGETLQCSQ